MITDQVNLCRNTLSTKSKISLYSYTTKTVEIYFSDVNKFKKASDVPEAGADADTSDITEATESTSAAAGSSETNSEDVDSTCATAGSSVANDDDLESISATASVTGNSETNGADSDVQMTEPTAS